MKIIAIEEHFTTPEIMSAWRSLAPELRDASIGASQGVEVERRLYDLLDERLRLMKDDGVDVQVISLGTPGVQSVNREDAPYLAIAANDVLAEAISRKPDRFQGFGTLPTSSPGKAAIELERCVNDLGFSGAMLYGRTGRHNLDDPRFFPIFEAAASLGVPISIHPQTPVRSLRETYYNGFAPEFNDLFASAGIGWHYETGIQVLRLILSGILDRLPTLQLIVGHWGEMLLFFLDRIDLMSGPAKLEQLISYYFKNNIYITPSGLLSDRYLAWAIDLLGSERILYATDYPYLIAGKDGSRKFLSSTSLNERDRNNIAHQNWERLRGNLVR